MTGAKTGPTLPKMASPLWLAFLLVGAPARAADPTTPGHDMPAGEEDGGASEEFLKAFEAKKARSLVRNGLTLEAGGLGSMNDPDQQPDKKADHSMAMMTMANAAGGETPGNATARAAALPPITTPPPTTPPTTTPGEGHTVSTHGAARPASTPSERCTVSPRSGWLSIAASATSRRARAETPRPPLSGRSRASSHSPKLGPESARPALRVP